MLFIDYLTDSSSRFEWRSCRSLEVWKKTSSLACLGCRLWCGLGVWASPNNVLVLLTPTGVSLIKFTHHLLIFPSIKNCRLACEMKRWLYFCNAETVISCSASNTSLSFQSWTGAPLPPAPILSNGDTKPHTTISKMLVFLLFPPYFILTVKFLAWALPYKFFNKRGVFWVSFITFGKFYSCPFGVYFNITDFYSQSYNDSEACFYLVLLLIWMVHVLRGCAK